MLCTNNDYEDVWIKKLLLLCVNITINFISGIQTKSAFISAMREIARVSCVRFVPRTYEKDYVRVITGDG